MKLKKPARSVRCPYCHAAPGEPCHGLTRNSHSQRVGLAYREQQREARRAELSKYTKAATSEVEKARTLVYKTTEALVFAGKMSAAIDRIINHLSEMHTRRAPTGAETRAGIALSDLLTAKVAYDNAIIALDKDTNR